jgi:KUP system potassium uptake protein
VLLAVNPLYGLRLLVAHPAIGLAILGAVIPRGHGCEALYADMGHFGRRPVAHGWLVLVWPALVLNYFGQGALLLSSGDAIANPFYALRRRALAVSRAAVHGGHSDRFAGGHLRAFSLTREAVQLDLLPRVRVLQTSAEAKGQIFVPAANMFLFVCVILFVLTFRSSSASGLRLRRGGDGHDVRHHAARNSRGALDVELVMVARRPAVWPVPARRHGVPGRHA